MKISTQYNIKIQEAQMEKVHSTEKLLNSVISRASRCRVAVLDVVHHPGCQLGFQTL